MDALKKSDLRILIAEDEKRVLDSMQFLFKQKGYTIFKANNGMEALTTISKCQTDGHPIDLLITDIQMPEMNGEELIKAVRTFDSRMRILVTTGYGEKDLVVRLMRLGCRDFIDKPFSPRELEQHVELLLDETYIEALEKKRNEHLALISDKARLLVHDLNNMMSSTLGYAQLVLRDIEDTHPARKRVGKLHASAQLAADLSNRLMGLKPENVHPQRTKNDLRTIVDTLMTTLRAIAPDSIEIQMSVPDQPVWLYADAERLQQALLNLGVNALDAMPNGGRLTYTISLKPMSNNPNAKPTSAVIVTVADTGDGIPIEYLSKVFKTPFTTKVHGHGFGLAAVKRIVTEHDGHISVKSVVGEGTEFTLSFAGEEMVMIKNGQEREFSSE
jgi:signal transduction histidine kinase